MLTIDTFLNTVTFTKYCYYWHDKYTIDKARIFHWQLVHGEIPAGCSVRRRCDTGNCVRAGHHALLRDCHPTNYLQRMALTREEREKAKKQTAALKAQEEEQAKRAAEEPAKVELKIHKPKKKRRRLTADEKKSIQARFKPRHPVHSVSALAREFGVSHALIQKIIRGKRYANVPDVAPITTAESPAMVQESNYIDQELS